MVDAEGEYTGLAERLGGRTVCPGSPGQGINPLCWSTVHQDLEEDALGYTVPKLGALRSVIQTIIRADPRDDPDDVINTTLVRYCGMHLDRKDPEGMSLEGYCEEMERGAGPRNRADPLARALRDFLEGGGRELTGGDFRINPEGMTTFDLGRVREELRPAATALCVNAAWDFAMTEFRPKVLIVDDSRWSEGGSGGGDLLNYLIKRARKLQLGITTIATDTTAFTNPRTKRGRAGRSILQNSAVKVAMREDDAGLKAICDALRLEGGMEMFIGQAGPGEAVVVNQMGEAEAARIHATSEELELMSPA